MTSRDSRGVIVTLHIKCWADTKARSPLKTCLDDARYTI